MIYNRLGGSFHLASRLVHPSCKRIPTKRTRDITFVGFVGGEPPSIHTTLTSINIWSLYFYPLVI